MFYKLRLVLDVCRMAMAHGFSQIYRRPNAACKRGTLTCLWLQHNTLLVVRNSLLPWLSHKPYFHTRKRHRIRQYGNDRPHVRYRNFDIVLQRVILGGHVSPKHAGLMRHTACFPFTEPMQCSTAYTSATISTRQ